MKDKVVQVALWHDCTEGVIHPHLFPTLCHKMCVWGEGGWAVGDGSWWCIDGRKLIAQVQGERKAEQQA